MSAVADMSSCYSRASVRWSHPHHQQRLMLQWQVEPFKAA
jgi:hypothetical protein